MDETIIVSANYLQVAGQLFCDPLCLQAIFFLCSLSLGSGEFHFTHSLPRVIDFKVPLQPHKKSYITQYKELRFSTFLTLMRDDDTTNILTNSLIHSFLNVWENVIFELGSERTSMALSLLLRIIHQQKTLIHRVRGRQMEGLGRREAYVPISLRFFKCLESAEIWHANSFCVQKCPCVFLFFLFFPQARKQGFKHILESPPHPHSLPPIV